MKGKWPGCRPHLGVGRRDLALSPPSQRPSYTPQGPAAGQGLRPFVSPPVLTKCYLEIPLGLAEYINITTREL